MKSTTKKCLLTIVLAIAMTAVFMPAAALAEGEQAVTSLAEFVAAIEDTGVTTINVTGDFALTGDVTIDRQVIITSLSDPGYTIDTDGNSIIIAGSKAIVNISGNLTVTGQEPIQVTNFGTSNISGGTVAATGEGSTGVYLISDGTANISGGTITAAGEYSCGVWVEVGTATVSGGTIEAVGGDSASVLVRPYSTANISGGTITASGASSAGVYVVCGSANISGGTITATGDASAGAYGVYVNNGTANISGGTITARSAYSCGVYANGVESAVTINGGTIVVEEEYGSGVSVVDGTADISGGIITATGSNGLGVDVCGGAANISGGTITATGTESGIGISVGNGGTLTISDEPEISGDVCGVYVSNSAADISGGTITASDVNSSGVFVGGSSGTVTISGGTITATGEISYGIYLYDGGTVIVSGDPEISGDANGVCVNNGTANISGGIITAAGIGSHGIYVANSSTITVSISANLIVSGGIYNEDGKVFLTDLPMPVEMTAGEIKTVELVGVDASINFEIDNRDTDSELAARIDDSDKNIVNLAPPDTTPAGTYTLALYATSGLNNFNLIIPVTTAAETIAPVLSAPGASDVTHTAANLNFTSDEAGTCYYLVYSAADTAPDKSTVKAQGAAVVKGTGAALAAANTVSVSGLAPSTTYKAYVVVEDTAGNISDVATINITTTAAPDTVIDIAAISGVTAPVRGSTPVTAIAATDQYTGTVSWSPAVVDDKFAASTVYTATITLTPKAGYTLTGVAANFFTVAGTTSDTNAANSGVITAVFPATEAATPPAISPSSFNYDLNAPLGITTTITWNSAMLVTGVVFSISPEPTIFALSNDDYSVVGDKLTIDDSFFSDIAVTTGESLTFTITFDTGATAELTVSIVDSYVQSSDADLSSLSVNGTPVTSFDPSNTEYNVELPYGTSVATVTMTASDPKAQVNITQASTLPGSATVTVTAEDETTTKTYIINLTIGEAPDTTYTINASAGSGGSISPSGTVSVTSGGSQTFTITPYSGYQVNSVTVDGTGQGAVSTYSFTNVTASHTITVTFTYIGGNDDKSGGSGATSTPSTPTVPEYKADVNTGNDSNSNMPVTIDKNSGIASVDVGTVNNLVSGGQISVVTVPPVPDVYTYTLNIPVPNLSTSNEQGALAFKTDIGTVTVPSNMLTSVEGINGSKVGISIGRGDKSNLTEDVRNTIGDRPLVQLTLSIDGKQTDWSNPNVAVTVSIPYTPTADELKNPESIVIWYIDGNGNAVSVPNGHYDPATGTVTFDTTHFSDYAVAYNKVSFNDVAAGAWYNKAVSFIAARGITGGTGSGNYSPDAKLTRGEFLVMLMKAYGISPDTNSTDNFSDAGNAYYTGYLAAAKRLGITTGVGNNQYAPGKEITRQEMFSLLCNALKVINQLPQGDSGKTLSDFTDAGQIDSWAKDAMTLLVETGTVSGNNGALKPLSTTSRSEMAQVLYNLLAK